MMKVRTSVVTKTQCRQSKRCRGHRNSSRLTRSFWVHRGQERRSYDIKLCLITVIMKNSIGILFFIIAVIKRIRVSKITQQRCASHHQNWNKKWKPLSNYCKKNHYWKVSFSIFIFRFQKNATVVPPYFNFHSIDRTSISKWESNPPNGKA